MCEEKYRLVKEYATAAKSLAEMAFKLRRLHGDGEEFKKARADYESARAECGQAREALRRHKTDHPCNGPLKEPAEARAACGSSA
jgi:hypothetical protein